MDIGFFIWNLHDMPDDPQDLADLCNAYQIKRLAIKVLNGTYKFNVPSGDNEFLAYTDKLWTAGIEVEAWGYHYPDNARRQGEAIGERRQALGFDVYHVDIEGEFKRPYGMGAAIRALLDPLHTDLEVLICSYRYPSMHPEIPWDAAMDHENTDGASPQVYWALRHDPVAQLTRTFHEYSEYEKPVYPIGSTFGASFAWGGEAIYWEPTVLDITAFREYNESHHISKIYYYSLDWILKRNRIDWLEAATGVEPGDPPPPEPPVGIIPIKQVKVNTRVLNIRSKPGISGDDIGNLLENSIVPVIKEKGNWYKVVGWIHKDYVSDT